MLKIKFIGTGSARASLKRNFTSLLFQTLAQNILIDSGEGNSKALLMQKVDLNSVDKILISHLHSDHYAGLAGLLTNLKLSGRNKPVYIISHKSNLPYLKNFLFSSFIIPERLNYEIYFEGFEFDEEITLTEQLKFIAKQNSHLNKYTIHREKYNLSLASPSFLFSHSGKKILFTSDIGSEGDLFLFTESVDILLCEIAHINLKDLSDSIKKLNPSETYIIHIPEEKEKEILNFLTSQTTELNQVYISFDGLEITLS